MRTTTPRVTIETNDAGVSRVVVHGTAAQGAGVLAAILPTLKRLDRQIRHEAGR